jgi:hypothetical protein
MKDVRNIVKLIPALIMICGGCNTPMISSTRDKPQPQVVATHKQPSSDQVNQYQNVLSGRAETADGTPFSFNLYKSSDGVAISVRVERHSLPAGARNELLRNIRGAIEVLERGPKLDESRKQVGERALLTSKQEESDALQTTVLWTEGSQLHFIESPSLQHALEFEKWYLRNP